MPALHFATVAHEVCAEHGALEHVHAGSEHEAEGVAPSKNATVSAAADSSDEHESCGVLGLSPPSALVAGGALASSFTLELAPKHALCEAPANASVALLSYAPKLAPPV